MICSRCQQNIAVVFINKLENGKQTTEGLCLKCAMESTGPIKQMMENIVTNVIFLVKLATTMKLV